ncbi:hypothetical protein G7072_06875 [Nocardioides sp. HDW12B]|uniref:hypothetical protein n=1 Tax=Nocardioides sp. HDW12B TaxID=2714939 RepID=UPI001407BFEB|nr:hypothetical protein [Nocardioides sp. HDW12B]QIK66103.1 hypothetical protein G7072_06875 [Nocardioides sp. HDW12B]
MWRWYVEVAFLVVLCFAAGAAVAALVIARVLPQASAPTAPTDTPGEGGASTP